MSKGFGNFSVKDLPERPVRNPRIGEELIASAKRKPVFKFGKTFIQAVQPDRSIAVQPDQSIAVQPDRSIPINSPVTSPVIPPPVPAELMQRNKKWFVNINGTTVEIAEKELITRGVDLNTPLWSQETGWKFAHDIPELSYLFPPPY
jgi:hypothetical protein